jgi:hypothetical protein
MLINKNACAVELSALRQDELAPLVGELDRLDLSSFDYVSLHAPSAMERSFEEGALRLLEQVASREWPIIVHPDAMFTPSEWGRLGNCLCVENMDKRKPIGQTVKDLAGIFELLPQASLCFDIRHARQVDPTMSVASSILHHFRSRIRQLHVSEVNSLSKHDPLSAESIFAFQKVSHLVPTNVPLILESRVGEAAIDAEIQNAIDALSTERLLAFTGD